MARLSLREAIEYIKLLRIDIFFLLFALSISIPALSNSKLIQDKYCISDLKVKPELCLNLEKLGPEYDQLKDKILKFSTTMGNYGTLITTPPTVLASLFLGYWLDSHPGHLRYLMAVPGLGSIASALIGVYFIIHFETKTLNLLWATIPTCFTGGFSIIIVGCYTYTARRTPPKYRSSRFAVMQFFVFIPMSVAISFGAHILYSKPWFVGQYRNYLGVSILTILSNLISAIWVVIFLYDAGDPQVGDDDPLIKVTSKKVQASAREKKEGLENVLIEKTSSPGKDDWKMESKDKKEPSSSDQQSACTIVSNMIRIFTRRRPENKRTVLLGMLLSIILLNIDAVGEGAVDFQFTQKVYRWDGTQYGDTSSIVRVVTTVCNTFLPALLIHKIGLDDTIVAIIGCVSLIVSVIIKGGFLEPWAYYVAAVTLIPSGLAKLSLMSLMSRVADANEVGRIYSIIGTIDSIGPIIASIIYTNIFNATLSTFPGMYHHITAVTVCLPLIFILWLDYTKQSRDPVVVRKNSRDMSVKEGELGIDPNHRRTSITKTPE